MKGVLPDVVRLEDIIEAIHDIEEHNHKDISNKKTLQATLYCLTIIGEACSKLSTDLMDRYPEIPWKNIINLRHRVVHDYGNVNVETVINVIEEYLTKRKQSIRQILDDIKS